MTPLTIRSESVKYPKLAAAIDDMLSKLVRENGEAFVQFAIEMAMQPAPEPVPEKLPPIPVTKEEVVHAD